MSRILITSCANRKYSDGREIIEVSSCNRGPLSTVAESWVDCHKSAPATRKAVETYKGRGFSEAIKACAETESELMIVSAGLGLISGDEQIPVYDATTASKSPNSIAKRIEGTFSPTRWWEEINRLAGRPEPIRALAANPRVKTVVLALPSSYLALVSAELALLDKRSRDKLRIITHGSTEKLPLFLQEMAVSYDDRFDGPDSPNPGTKSDFFQRAARHFMVSVLAKNLEVSAAQHSDLTKNILSSMRKPIRPIRQTASDEHILMLIAKDFHRASIRGRSSSMLRHLRDNRLIACEQSRFRHLFNSIKDSL